MSGTNKRLIDEKPQDIKKAEQLLSEYRGDLDSKVVRSFNEAGIEEMDTNRIREYQPFHWVLEFAEVYADGGFDVVVSNSPWDQLRPGRDDFFSRYDKQFRTRTQSEKDEIQAELLVERTIATGWEEHHKRMEIRAKYFNNNQDYRLQNLSVAGRGVASENELSSLFLERTFDKNAYCTGFTGCDFHWRIYERSPYEAAHRVRSRYHHWIRESRNFRSDRRSVSIRRGALLD